MNIFENKTIGKQSAIKLLLKALMVIFIVVTQLYCSADVNGGEKSVEEDLLKKEQIKNIIQKADTFFNRQQYTTPKDANAYDLYQEVLKTEPSNQYALGKVHDIFNALLDSLLEETRNKFEPAMREEEKRGEINEKVIPILKNMLSILEELKKICKSFPNRDSEAEKACNVLEDKIKKYNKILSLRK